MGRSLLWQVCRDMPGRLGYAMHALPDDSEVPWHRVVNANGEISIRSEPLFADIQRKLLEAEGIEFNQHNRIDLKTDQWNPLL